MSYNSKKFIRKVYMTDFELSVNKKYFIHQLLRCKRKGIKIMINGKEAGEDEWDKIFVLKQGRIPYQGEYIHDENSVLTSINFKKVKRDPNDDGYTPRECVLFK